MPERTVRIFEELERLSEAAANELASIAKVNIHVNGAFKLALAGGETPRTLYEILARNFRDAIDWQHVHIFWGDERYVPQDDPASNYRMAKETLIDTIPIPSNNIHPIPILADPFTSSDTYAKELQSFFREPIPTFDLILLGLGDDGHTASLFPGMTGEEMNNGLVIVTHSPAPPPVRISLTLKVLNNARNIFFLVAGEEKKEILKKVLAERENSNSRYPASRVLPVGELIWFTNELPMDA